MLVVVLSRTTYEDGETPVGTNSFSTGASWENLALEGTRRGLAVHPIRGFDAEKARTALNVPDDVDVEILTAIGVRGPKEALSERDRRRERPSTRKPLVEIVAEGGFER